MDGKDYKYPKLVHPPKIPLEYRGILIRSQALERWGSMREKTTDHFKFTPRTTFYCILWAGVVPFLVYSAIKWDRKRKNKLIVGPKQDYL